MTTSLLFKEVSYDMGPSTKGIFQKKKKLLLYNILQMQKESDVLCEVLNKEINNQL